MIEWAFSDPTGRLFAVFPLFSLFIFAIAGVKMLRPVTTPPWLEAVIYVSVLVSVLFWWAIYPSDWRGVVRAAVEINPAVVGTAIGLMPLVALVYLGELWLSDWRNRNRTSSLGSDKGGPIGRRVSSTVRQLQDASLIGLGLPASGDSSVSVLPTSSVDAIDTVRVVSRSPGLFAAISLGSAVAEELVYRGAMMDGLRASTGVLVALAVQTLAYAANHLAFGAPAVVGKLILGLLLGSTVVAVSSVWPALVGHLWFQYLVWRRLRKVDAWSC